MVLVCWAAVLGEDGGDSHWLEGDAPYAAHTHF